MPSQTKSWVTEHEDLSLLRIASSDPRRGGRIDLAYFDTAISEQVKSTGWCIRRGEPYSIQLGTSLANFCAKLYGKPYRYEPGPCYTSSNYYASALTKEQFIEQVVSKNKHIPLQDKFCDKTKYKKRTDFVELEVQVQCRRFITILVNSCHTHLIPRKLFLSHIRNELCIWPTKEKRNKRNQVTLAYYLLNKINPRVYKHAYKRTEGNLLDYRVREDESGYINSVSQYIKFHHIKEGTVIEVGYVQGACDDVWVDTNAAFRYPQGTLMPGDARKAYVLVKDYEPLIDAYIKYDNYNFTCETFRGKQTTIERVCASHANMQIEDIMIPSRNTKGYDKAIERGDLRRRARYENKIISEQATNGRMFTAPRFIKRRRVYADTTTEVSINGVNVYALDCRPENLIVGSKGRTKQQESKPLSAHELQTILSTLQTKNEPKPELREDI